MLNISVCHRVAPMYLALGSEGALHACLRVGEANQTLAAQLVSIYATLFTQHALFSHFS